MSDNNRAATRVFNPSYQPLSPDPRLNVITETVNQFLKRNLAGLLTDYEYLNAQGIHHAIYHDPYAFVIQNTYLPDLILSLPEAKNDQERAALVTEYSYFLTYLNLNHLREQLEYAYIQSITEGRIKEKAPMTKALCLENSPRVNLGDGKPNTHPLSNIEGALKLMPELVLITKKSIESPRILANPYTLLCFQDRISDEKPN
ncbi:hypothetical protein JW711_04840 [Candidatus Woesearchaeota archaeon]|nr:hypothetical protein [Candidatus Woesearchaeota archaeon]